MYFLFFAPFAVFLIMFIVCFRVERRTLLCGILFVAAGAALFFALLACLVLLDMSGASPAAHWLYTVLPLLMSVIGLLPTALVLATLAAGIMNLVRYGLHRRNTFAVVFSVAVLAYTIVRPWVGKLRSGTASSMIYFYVTAIVLYTIMLKTVLTVTSELNLFHLRKFQDLDYVLVLGRPIKRETLAVMVRNRVAKGVEVLRANPGSRLVLSGGWDDGGREACSVMADYARDMGVREEDILLDRSVDGTQAMVKNSYQLMRGDHRARGGRGEPRFAVVTTAYHVLRTLIAARRSGIKCMGFGARTKLHVSMNAFVREYVQYLRMTRKGHLILLLVFTVLYWGGSLLLMKLGVLDPQVWSAGR